MEFLTTGGGPVPAPWFPIAATEVRREFANLALHPSVQRWLSVAAGEVAYGPAAARLVTVFGSKHNPEEVIGRAHVLLARLEQHLSNREWLAADHPTIADIALYSYIARAPEGNVDLSNYPSANAFLRRIEALPGFVPFVKTPVGLGAAA